MSVLKFDNVSKSFGEGTAKTDVLKNINLEVQEGEFLWAFPALAKPR